MGLGGIEPTSSAFFILNSGGRYTNHCTIVPDADRISYVLSFTDG